MKTLIGFCGAPYSGKDESAYLLSEITGIPKYSFAYPIKKIIGDLFNFDSRHSQGELKEDVKLYTTERWRRNIVSLSRGYLCGFINHLEDYEIIDKFYKTVLLPHMASENEYKDRATLHCSPRQLYQKFGTEFGRSIKGNLWIDIAKTKYEEQNALIIPDLRFNNEAEWIKENKGMIVKMNREESKEVSIHSSETSLLKEHIDITVCNNGTLEDLKVSIQMVSDYYLQSPVVSTNDFL